MMIMVAIPLFIKYLLQIILRALLRPSSALGLALGRLYRILVTIVATILGASASLILKRALHGTFCLIRLACWKAAPIWVIVRKSLIFYRSRVNLRRYLLIC